MSSDSVELFSRIQGSKIHSCPEFNHWFNHDWAVRNSLSQLSAPLDKIKRGALIEWEYLNRGARVDPRKYCDVILGESAGELAGKIVDTKYVHIRSTRGAALPEILKRQRTRREWYAQLGIDEIHVWSDTRLSQTITPWFRYLVDSDTTVFV